MQARRIFKTALSPFNIPRDDFLWCKRTAQVRRRPESIIAKLQATLNTVFTSARFASANFPACVDLAQFRFPSAVTTDCVEIISLLLCFPLKFYVPVTGKKAPTIPIKPFMINRLLSSLEAISEIAP